MAFVDNLAGLKDLCIELSRLVLRADIAHKPLECANCYASVGNVAGIFCPRCAQLLDALSERLSKHTTALVAGIGMLKSGALRGEDGKVVGDPWDTQPSSQN